jgi:tetratricopeptide (TPR) repeat protein
VNELRVLFDRSAAGLTFRLAASWGGDAGPPQAFKPFLGEDDYEDLRWYLEEFMELPDAGGLVRAARIERALDDWGKELHAQLFGDGDHRELLNTLLDEDAPRLLTVGTQDPELLRLPWELLRDARGPLSSRGVTIRRQLEKAGRPVRYDAGRLPLRILLIVSRPDDAGFLDPRWTTRAMLDALDPLGEGVRVDFCRPPTLGRMDEMLAAATRKGEPYQIVHFDGHGTFLKEIQLGALCFEKADDDALKVGTDMVRADRIGDLLAAHKVPLAILEACQSAEIGPTAAFRSVAPRLLDAGVGSVLAMSHAVHVEATRVLLDRFYKELCQSATVGEALEQGRSALIANPHRWLTRGPGGESVALKDWFLPNLYQRGEDLRLVPGGSARAGEGDVEGKGKGAEPGGFPRPPLHHFHGRARELHQLERRFQSHRAVLLHAMGGMGKTSLAREAAYWWTRTGLFPDGACFLSFEQGGGAERIAQVLGSYLEGAAFEKLSGEEQGRRARELFQKKRVLMVWDNFESVLPAFNTEGSAALYPEEARAAILKTFEEWTGEAGGKGRLLITCRPGETGLLGAQKTELFGLARVDALGLLVRVMKTAGVDAGSKGIDREGLLGLVKEVGYHPLSIELVGPHLKGMTPGAIVADFKGLLGEFKGDAEVERNRSLLASLAFSTKRLGKEAQEALGWLGMFRGGVFEQALLAVSKMDPEVWEAARAELEATALVRVEREFLVNDRPYIRFHPTLAHAVFGEERTVVPKQHFVGVYGMFMKATSQALLGANPRDGMEMMEREEANFRTAVVWALEQKAYGQASAIGDTLHEYLQRAGRLRERDRWVRWLAGEVRKGGFSQAVAYRETAEAWSLLTQGHSREAIAKLEALVARLETTTAFDPAFALANARQTLGRMYDWIGWCQKAVPVLQSAMEQREALVERELANGKSTETERGNLADTMGDLANALMSAGRLDEAMVAAERGIAIDRELGRHRGLAAGLGQSAQILMTQGRHLEADARYNETLQAARQAGDRELEGITFLHQGSLANDRKQYERAAKLYQRALQHFQDIHDEGSIMQTCNLLGVVEQQSGRLAEARAWYERSHELAERRGDRQAVGAAAQNLGIVCQFEAEAARKRGNEVEANMLFTDAIRFVGENLQINVQDQNEPFQANAHGQLAQIHLLIGNLDQAEEHAQRAREIFERLHLKEAHVAYNTLAQIARARGDEAQTTSWERQRNDLRAELTRRAGTPTALPPDFLRNIQSLAIACAQTGFDAQPLTPQVEEALAQIAKLPAPLNALSPTLRALTEGRLPPVPAALPPELQHLLTQLFDAIQQK